MRKRTIAGFLLMGVVACLTCLAEQARQDVGLKGRKLPEGFGLSAKYPGDAGIGRGPTVLLGENFETGTIADLRKRWEDVKNPSGKVLAFSQDVPTQSPGKRSLRITATLHENTGGHLYTRLPRGVDKVFARFYVKFPGEAEYVHHFVHLGGYNPPTRWPQGGAGERPRGHERMTVGIEPWGSWGRHPAPGIWNFYAYWHEMKASGDGRYWGNSLRPARPQQVPRGRWQCVEVMMNCNSKPHLHDGELALWLDGRLVAHFVKGAIRGPWPKGGFQLVERGGELFEGFCWRKSNDLKINFFWLMHYVTPNAARQNRVKNPRRVNRVWFDHIVLSTEYVGPIKKPDAGNE